MKILYFYQYFGTSKGCWSTRVYEFARRWVAAGDEVTVVTSVYDRSDLEAGSFVSEKDVEGIRVKVINVRLSNRHGFLVRVGSFFAYAIVASWFAVRERADVVVSSSGPITVAIPGLIARYLRRRPFVFEVRDLWPEGAIQLGLLQNRAAIWAARLLERTSYRAARRVVALSPGMAEWIRERYPEIRHISVIPNASDNDLANQVRRQGSTPRRDSSKSLALYAGTLGLIDDCGQILRAAKILQDAGDDDIEIKIIGDGNERDQIVAEAQKLGLRNIEFLGRQTKETVMSWLTAADCALFICKDVPFLNTASPNKLFDAFAAGVPVVQTTSGWIRELFEKERCGLSVPPGDAAALAEALRRVCRDQRLREDLAANSKRVGLHFYDRGLTASRLREILREASEPSAGMIAVDPAAPAPAPEQNSSSIQPGRFVS